MNEFTWGVILQKLIKVSLDYRKQESESALMGFSDKETKLTEIAYKAGKIQGVAEFLRKADLELKGTLGHAQDSEE